MKKTHSIVLFNQKQIRRFYDEEKELWYFSIIDIIEVLTDSSIPRRYWSDLKGFSTEDLLRVIQSIPSPKAEPFKLWLAKVGYERIEETEDPELAFDRAMKTYLQKGYSREWINQRLKSIEVRKELTDEWQERGMKEGLEYAILTNEITKAWADRTVKNYKELKGLKKENLRDNMTNLELVLNMLAEVSTAEISKKKKPKGLENNKQIAKEGGYAAKKARLEIEKQTGESVITSKSSKYLKEKQRPALLDKNDK